MRKWFCVVGLVGVLFITNSFAGSKKNNLFSEVGFIKSYGNTPIVYPKFVSENGKIYFIESNEYTKNELLELQGKKILLSGTVSEQKSNETFEKKLEDETIYIMSIKIISEKK